MNANILAGRHPAAGRGATIATSPFVPDICVPEQWAALFTSNARSGEQRLMAAILEDAISEFQQSARVRHPGAVQRHTAVRAWFDAEDTHWIFSARNICETLGIDLDYLRAGLARWLTLGQAAPRLYRQMSGVPGGKRPTALRAGRGLA